MDDSPANIGQTGSTGRRGSSGGAHRQRSTPSAALTAEGRVDGNRESNRLLQVRAVDRSQRTHARCESHGSHVERDWIRLHSTVCGITADARHVFWISDEGDVGRADLSGANVNEKFIKTSRRALATVAVSPSFIFWIDREGIGRANIDGKNVKEDFLPADFATSLAVEGNYLYWNNLGALLGGTTIGRAKLDGAAVNQKFIDLTPVDRHPCGLTVVDERMFFANCRPGNFGEDFSINFTGLSSNDVELTHFGKQFPCPSALAANPEGPTALSR